MFIWRVAKDGWELMQGDCLRGSVRVLGTIVELTSRERNGYDSVTCYPLDAFGGGLTVAECRYQVVAELVFSEAERANGYWGWGEQVTSEARAELALLEGLLLRMHDEEKDTTSPCQHVV